MIERCPDIHEDCPYFNQRPRKPLRSEGETTGCYSDSHHEYFPARDYQTPIEKAFRELPENRQQICRWLHDLAHLEQDPQKPDLLHMLQALSIREGERV